MKATAAPNRLLIILMVLSVGVHTVILLHLTRVYQSKALSYIELSMRNIVKPSTRVIPRPRPRPRNPEPRNMASLSNPVQRSLPRFPPPVAVPAANQLPDALAEGIHAPDVPQAPAMTAADWVAGTQAPDGDGMTAASYLDLVRLKIESRKRYPEAARTRSIEGRVTIRFILATDGSVRNVTVKNGARSHALNLAALEAVKQAAPFPRPPSNLFKGDLALELVIVFELT